MKRMLETRRSGGKECHHGAKVSNHDDDDEDPYASCLVRTRHHFSDVALLCLL